MHEMLVCFLNSVKFFNLSIHHSPNEACNKNINTQLSIDDPIGLT